MSKLNIYRCARIRASKKKSQLKNRETASELLGVSKDSLTNYELNLCKHIPADIVVKMSKVYEAPELLNNYCHSECPIGHITVPPIDNSNVDNIFKLSISISNILKKGNALRDKLLDILDDGIIDDSEKEDLNLILSNLKKLSGLTNELIIASKKIK